MNWAELCLGPFFHEVRWLLGIRCVALRVALGRVAAITWIARFGAGIHQGSIGVIISRLCTFPTIGDTGRRGRGSCNQHISLFTSDRLPLLVEHGIRANGFRGGGACEHAAIRATTLANVERVLKCIIVLPVFEGGLWCNACPGWEPGACSSSLIFHVIRTGAGH
ncbi:hypothetical protein SAMN04488527_10315 [Aliiroseovarius crassostreae]|nr:hypothetical protein SAMN04488527_10315 [Aliiroseovarius crassostreae]